MNIKHLSIILLTTILFNFSNSSVNADTIVFSDDFSNGLDKWQATKNNFDLWSIVENQAQAYVNRRSTLTSLVPKDEYWNPEWKNIVFDLTYKYLTGADKNLVFGYIDNANFYTFHFVGSSYILSHVKEGRVSWDISDYISLTSNTNHHFSISINEGHIIVYFNDKLLFDVVDPTFDNDYGKIGMQASTGSIYPTIAIYDDIVVKLIQEVKSKLEIISIKQQDPIWADIEYDSAGEWSLEANTISDWGCVISSVSMIMNYHGIDKMPDGNSVNPETVNNWLKNETDGYIGGGLINWSAITRLTKNINEIYQTSKLEYSRSDGNSYAKTILEVKENKPVILQIPGHFLVGNGYTEDESDLLITDPAYTYETFSEHNQELLSTRTFQPTFTNLSYIHIINDPNISIEVSTTTGNIETLQTYEEYLTSANNNQLNSPNKIKTEIEKPTTGKYFITITAEELQEYNIVIFAYDTEGEFSDLRYSGVVGQEAVVLEIDYHTDSISNISTNVSFISLQNDINQLWNENKISKHYVYHELNKAVNFAINDSDFQIERHIDKLEQLLNWYSFVMTDLDKIILEARLEEIRGII